MTRVHVDMCAYVRETQLKAFRALGAVTGAWIVSGCHSKLLSIDFCQRLRSSGFCPIPILRVCLCVCVCVHQKAFSYMLNEPMSR